MFLESIWLNNFRSHEDRVVQFGRGTTVVVGGNGSGKTNLLEAMALLATGKSFRAERQEEMVGLEREVGRVKGVVGTNQEKHFKYEIPESSAISGSDIRGDGGGPTNHPQPLLAKGGETAMETTELEVVLTRGMVSGAKAPRKRLLVNGVARQLKTFVGNLQVVLFGPDDLGMVSGSPSKRRAWLDGVLSQVDREYYRSLLAYENGVKRRNKLLLAIREREATREQLWFWDRLLIKEGNVLQAKRRELVEFVNGLYAEADNEFRGLKIEYDASGISEQRLQQYAREEVAAGVTLVGPHRDDWRLESRITNHESRMMDLRRFGSRGEQRMGVLWLKLGELAYMESVSEQRPVLLLDDIFSELDHAHRDLVVELIRQQQTILTAADEHLVEGVGGGVVKL